MSSRYSPPLKPIHLTPNPPSPPSLLLRRPRYLYALLALLVLYLWHTFPVHRTSHVPIHDPSLIYRNVDWTRFAYSLYATNSAYLCNALMVYESLSRLGSKADRVLFYPQEWDLEIESSTDRDSQLLVKARDDFGVKLMPSEGEGMEFMAWSLTQYDRVLHLDSDITIFKHMDGLFMAPKTSVALVRSYWRLPTVKELASSFVLLEPSELEFQQLTISARSELLGTAGGSSKVLNRFYGDSAMVLPHREYGLLSEEFRSEAHTAFLGNNMEVWDPEKVLKQASLVRFSDEPLPKPWIMWPHKLIGEIMPKCKLGELGNDDCRNKKIWMELYDDFRKRRKVRAGPPSSRNPKGSTVSGCMCSALSSCT